MIRPSIKITLLIFLILAAIAVIFLNKYIIKDASVLYPKFIQNFLVFTWDKMGSIKSITVEFKKWRLLAKENEELQKKNNELIHTTAVIDNLENENKFLRKTLNFAPGIKGNIVYGNVFNLSLTSDGYSMLLNKGSSDGILTGETVVTEDGVLVGQIRQVFKNFSKVLFISDSNFKINAKVAGSDTIGLVKGALKDGLLFDLIVQEDQVKEGDMIISNGNDMFPAALIIGTVSYVETNESKIFKKVKIIPAINKIKLGRVLIIGSIAQ